MTGRFKTSLFGYSKRDVCEYISKASDELTQKHKNEEVKLEEKIKELQTENTRLNRIKEDFEKRVTELEERIKQSNDENGKVSQILIDASRFADELRNKAMQQNEIEMKENAKRNAAVAETIKKCNDEIDTIRDFLKSVIENTDRELVKTKERLERVGIVAE